MDSASVRMEHIPPLAEHKRRAWAQTKDSVWQQSSTQPQTQPEQVQEQEQNSTEKTGRVPNKITSWLSECRTPIGASLDDHTATPNKVLRNGCSFEDDLSLGAEANHLQSNPSRSETGFSIGADQKRTQYKERGHSMNSTGSGKSSTVSSVSELLDLYEEDPEEILLNLGFGREEPDLASKVPSRFFNNSSFARGIDIKVFLGAQMQRLELENPNYALTSRFRQIEVLTTVANELFQLYSHVSGQPPDLITHREPGGQSGAREEPPLRKSNSALNAAKLLKKSISRHNVLGSAASTSSTTASSDNTKANTQKSKQPEELELPKHTKLKDTGLATVSEETIIDGDIDRDTPHSTEQNSVPAANGTLESADVHTTNHNTEEVAQSTNNGTEEVDQSAKQGTEEGDQTTNQGTEQVEQTVNRSKELAEQLANQATGEVEQTSNQNIDEVEQTTNDSTEQVELTHATGEVWLEQTDQVAQSTNHNTDLVDQTANDSTVEVAQTANHITGEAKQTVEQKANQTSTPERLPIPQLALLRTENENADSFDIEEIQSIEDDVLPNQSSRNAEMSRTVSQQSDSSGFAEEPSSDSNSFLKIQESSDSCDSETTVTSHPSQDLATPLATDQPAFSLLTSTEEVIDEHDGSTEVIPQYIAHQLPRNRGRPEPHRTLSQEVASALESENSPKMSDQIDCNAFRYDRSEVLDELHKRPLGSPDFLSDSSEISLPPAPPSPVVSALNRAKLNQRGSARGKTRSVPLQRSSSLPTTVVSSVHIQLGRGKALCTQPQYTHKPGPDGREDGGEDQLSSQKPLHLSEPVAPLKAIPHHLMRSSRSLHSSSPPPDWHTGGSWSTQSVPELFENSPQITHQQNTAVPNPQNNFSYFNPYSSMPNLFPPQSPVLPPYPTTNPAMHPYSFANSPHHTHSIPPNFSHASTATPTMPRYAGSYSNLHHPVHAPTTMSPNFSQYSGMSLGTATPTMPQYSSYSSLHHQTAQTPPYMGYHGYYPQHFPPEVSPPQPGFHYLHSSPGSVFGCAPGVRHQPPSNSELQLHRVLQEIRGTLHSLGQSRSGTPDVYGECRAASSQQTVSELLQKRRSLNAFRRQMMDLEMSIMRDQAQVYRHLSPSDRLEVDQLQRLRSAVREELQELEQQLEERLLELTPSSLANLHQHMSEENLSTSTALRAMEPVSDLLREQLFLQSELSFHGNSPSTASSSRCSSPCRAQLDNKGAGVYRTSINITPVPPLRPNMESPQLHTTEEACTDSRNTEEQQTGNGLGQEAEAGVQVDNLQQLIKEIRQSVAQEIRREIYTELLAAVTPPKQQSL